MGNSFKFGRLFGVEIGVHWSWVLIFGVVTWSFATGVLKEFYPGWSEQQRWIGGAFVAGIFFVSVLAHELSHAIVSNRNGLPVRTITLFVFGGVANLTKEPESPGLEFRIAIVGPATSLALGVLFAALWFGLRDVNEGVAGISANLALINASLAVFNMLPGFPLDGGRVFRSIIWHRNRNRLRATRTASRVGEAIAYGMMGLGLFMTVTFGDFSGIWLLFIGFFLRNASVGSYEQLAMETALRGVTVSQVMQEDVAKVAPDVSLEDLVHQQVFVHGARAFAVMAAGDFAGLVTLTDIRKQPREAWATTSVYRAMTPATQLHTVSPGDSLTSALQLMALHDVNQVPVVRGRELMGMVTRADLMRFIQTRRELETVAGASGAQSTGPGG
ncbi:MAG: site-2 protease family protein [Chloroflexi bacterium]|nr:site-2 protease family protein [Chloroflexota bacterium]